jgi:hypothetical protein
LSGLLSGKDSDLISILVPQCEIPFFYHIFIPLQSRVQRAISLAACLYNACTYINLLFDSIICRKFSKKNRILSWAQSQCKGKTLKRNGFLFRPELLFIYGMGHVVHGPSGLREDHYRRSSEGEAR